MLLKNIVKILEMIEKLGPIVDLSLTHFQAICENFYLFFQNFSKNLGDTLAKDLLFFEILVE